MVTISAFVPEVVVCRSDASGKKNISTDELAMIPVYFSGNHAINGARYTDTACEQGKPVIDSLLVVCRPSPLTWVGDTNPPATHLDFLTHGLKHPRNS